MKNNLISKQAVTINATTAKVWDALVNPEIIKQYLFGTNAVSDWKAGSPIKYTGMWNGKNYEDKGTILHVVPEKLLETTYWSGISGLRDTPENYKKVRYELQRVTGGTRIEITQDNNATEEEKQHTEQNWKTVLNTMKDVLEHRA
jgi:uncharacterized protein YndB with AHSA1/START domain